MVGTPFRPIYEFVIQECLLFSCHNLLPSRSCAKRWSRQIVDLVLYDEVQPALLHEMC